MNLVVYISLNLGKSRPELALALCNIRFPGQLVRFRPTWAGTFWSWQIHEDTLT